MTNKQQTDREKRTIIYLKQMTNSDLITLTKESKQELIKVFSEFILFEDNINAVSFTSNSDYINKRIEEIYYKGLLE